MPRIYRDSAAPGAASEGAGAPEGARPSPVDGVVDRHIGGRLRRRRKLMGMAQHQLAAALGVRFQQIQKYESGANRLSASRLWRLTQVLEVPIGYFFEGL